MSDPFSKEKILVAFEIANGEASKPLRRMMFGRQSCQRDQAESPAWGWPISRVDVVCGLRPQ